jgi:2-succinyl-5-enolpyruvyl-6-hydroxy-3-cyclohexene-1-carboxylate synthase
VSNASADATSGSPATDYAVELLSALIDAGVREIVLSPGSRSQALALVAADLERAGRVRLRVRIDERSAATRASACDRDPGLRTISRTPASINADSSSTA